MQKTRRHNRAQQRKTAIEEVFAALHRNHQKELQDRVYAARVAGEKAERERLTLFINPEDIRSVRKYLEPPRIHYLQNIQQPYVRVYDVPEMRSFRPDYGLELDLNANVHTFRAEPLDRVLPNGTRVRWYNWTMVG